ncbi:dephospho-CoA kinase [Aliishimia ponticola]|uniref:Dephospho-CoA kinase n=1 Tax=Aliishimia ponticola TaxID=2499833 RepID=A0A4S4N694_9RHOB|nr:dephospho-CoA kinase [Aliishimia ponticola]THH34642.1 dephospho-CoA kinase [Aliishimia ponticola]
MMFLLGLTGSIGMGKSTTAEMFAQMGCAVWDADAAVHRLYRQGGAAVAPMAKAFPDAIVDGAVSRAALKTIIGQDPSALKVIEGIVHPLVLQDRKSFMESANADIAVFDIPLLFETGAEREFDAVACVFVAEEIQRQRVLDRGTMTAEQLDMIIAKQLPAREKADRADFVIVTDTLEHARAQVEDVVKQIRKDMDDA